MSEKKRKRASEKVAPSPSGHVSSNVPSNITLNGSSNPAKRVNVNFIEDNAKLGPVLASTPGLTAPKDIPLTPYTKSSKKRKTSQLMLHSSTHPRLTYVATEPEPESLEGSLQHYLGVYDPATGALNLVEPKHVVLRTYLRPTQAQIDTEAKEKDEVRSMVDKRADVIRAFGTKKAKRALESSLENDMSGQRVSEAEVAAQLSQISTVVPTQEELNKAMDTSKPKPVPNLHAENPSEVYSLERLIGKDTLKSIHVDDWIEQVGANEDIVTTSRFVSSRVVELVGRLDDEATERLKGLRYLYALIQFLSACKNGFGGGLRLPKPEELKEKVNAVDKSILESIKRKFSEAGNMTKWFVDYSRTHLCVLSLIIDGLESDFSDLRDDLKLDSKQFTQYFHEVGARVRPMTETERTRRGLTKAEASTRRMAILRLPLEFPKMRQKRLKR